MTFISGNTYPNRHIIKPLGFSWDKQGKYWKRPLPLTPEEETTLSDVKGIIVDYGSQGIVIDTRPARTHKQIYGRCEDAPCCGCCGPQFY